MFKVIESYDEAAALGKCGLLWFRCDDRQDWRPSVRHNNPWGSPNDSSGRANVASGMYAILLED